MELRGIIAATTQASQVLALATTGVACTFTGGFALMENCEFLREWYRKYFMYVLLFVFLFAITRGWHRGAHANERDFRSYSIAQSHRSHGLGFQLSLACD